MEFGVSVILRIYTKTKKQTQKHVQCSGLSLLSGNPHDCLCLYSYVSGGLGDGDWKVKFGIEGGISLRKSFG